MGENTKIEWATHTFNPWIGCTKVSEGCFNCYAEALMDHRWRKVEWGVNGTRKRTSSDNWKKPLHWDRQAEKSDEIVRVFCASLCDIFEPRLEVEHWRWDLMTLIEATPNLIWMLLTKRPGDVIKNVPGRWLSNWPRNVWIGTSIENEKVKESRLEQLKGVPAHTRFISAEPLIGPLDLGHSALSGIHWVIVGGESGPNHRPMKTDWIHDIMIDCTVSDTAFFFKQWGGPKPGGPRELNGQTWSEFPC